jgi:cell division protein FtsB
VTEGTIAALFLLVGVLFTAVVSVVVAVVTVRQKATAELVAELRAELNDTRAKVIATETRIAALERRDKAWANYVHKLRRHISDELPPPPPEWPADLDR